MDANKGQKQICVTSRDQHSSHWVKNQWSKVGVVALFLFDLKVAIAGFLDEDRGSRELSRHALGLGTRLRE